MTQKEKISRLRSVYAEWCKSKNVVPTYSDGSSLAEYFLSQGIEPVVQGQWISEGTNVDGISFYRCSVCGAEINVLPHDDIAEAFPYCKCGARNYL